MFRQDLRCLFQMHMVSVVQKFRVTDSAINGIGEILASRPSTEEEGKPIPPPRLHTFRLNDVDFASTSHAGWPFTSVIY